MTTEPMTPEVRAETIKRTADWLISLGVPADKAPKAAEILTDEADKMRQGKPSADSS
jgi:hypothetical protein